ncbi:hypothetical protein [Streptomyces sp. NPDC088261]|uniref:DUF6197 family protein n=1 Tax=Streptomyces sp. NPDC088261 TaxID=3365851 RepID=UPI0038025839
MTEDRQARDFVRDVEVYVSALAPTTPLPNTNGLIGRAYALAGEREPEGWLRWGNSGLPMSGADIAAHAETAGTVLRRIGWNPSDTACLSIRDALILSVREDETGRLSEDTRYVLVDVLNYLIRAMTGAPHANFELWDMHPRRTVDEVFGLLAAASVFARAYGRTEAATA